MQNALLTLGGWYKAADWEATVRVGLHSWQVTYQHQLKDLSLIAECNGNLMQVGHSRVQGNLMQVSHSGVQWQSNAGGS